MSTKTSIRHFIVSLTPPIIYPALRKIINSSFVYTLNKKIGVNFYAPTWNTILRGQFRGIKLFFDASKGVWEKEMVQGTYDQYFYDYLKNFNLKGKIFFDVGAHIGYSTLTFASLVGPKGKVYAFEPNRFNADRLKINIAKNFSLSKRITVNEVAIANSNGTQDLIFTNNIEDWTSSGSFIASAHTFMDKDSYQSQFGFEKTTVETVTLDSFIKKNKVTPDFIKIDIEGAEIFALEGAKELLKKKKCVFFIELHSIFNGFSVTQLLIKNSYDVTILHEENDGRIFISAVPRK